MATGLKTIVVLPAFNAEKTLEKTYYSIPEHLRKDAWLIDDYSKDKTIEIARMLGLNVLEHDKNKGYGANQKTCYSIALNFNADIIVMLHPDYQYLGEDIPKLITPIENGSKDFMMGSRIKNARYDHMPIWKYLGNRFLTILEKLALNNYELHEFHSGFRAYSRRLLESVNYKSFSNDFSFDSEMIFEAIRLGFRIGEIDTRTRYFSEASSINFKNASFYYVKTLNLLFNHAILNKRHNNLGR